MADIATLSQAEKDPTKIAFVVRQLAERMTAATGTSDIADGAVTTPKIADDAVQSRPGQ